MFSHVMLGSNDVAAAGEFYAAVLAPLGLESVYQGEDHVAFAESEAAQPWFWVTKPYDGNAASVGNGTHVAFLAPSREAVRRFYDVALALGGQDEGAPGLRPQYSETYYGTYVRDPDGNKIQAVCYAPDS